MLAEKIVVKINVAHGGAKDSNVEITLKILPISSESISFEIFVLITIDPRPKKDPKLMKMKELINIFCR